MYESETAEFRDLFDYLMDKRNQAKEDRYPVQAGALLKEMESNPELYSRRLNVTNSDEHIYWDVPILAWIDVDTFISTLLKLHPGDQRTIMTAFKSRYENGRLDRELAAEKAWLGVVRDKLIEAANTMPTLGKYRLTKFIEQNIVPALTEEQQQVPLQD